MQQTPCIQQLSLDEQGFQMELSRSAGAWIVRLVGKVGLEQGEAFEQAMLCEAERLGGVVALDLTGLRFINVIGLGVIVRFGQAIHAGGGRLTLHGADDNLCRLLRRVRLHELFPPLDPTDPETGGLEPVRELATCA